VRVYLTSDQIKRATKADERGLNLGYRVLAVNEVWGWEETAHIFREMIGVLMLDKLKATPPSKLKMDKMTHEQQVAFIADYCDRLHIDVSSSSSSSSR
jgi:hypothetical protein